MTTDQEMTIDGLALDSHTATLHALRTTEARNEELTRKVVDLTHDIQTIARKLRTEAIDRDWCSDYGNFVDEVNDMTHGDWLEHCEFGYMAVFTVHVPFTTRHRNYSDATSEISMYLGSIEDLDEANVGEITVDLRSCEPTED